MLAERAASASMELSSWVSLVFICYLS
jgi:hypothetical protein